jgi:hypothetical protein
MRPSEIAERWLQAKAEAEAKGFTGSKDIELVCRAYLRLREAALGVKEDGIIYLGDDGYWTVTRGGDSKLVLLERALEEEDA